MSMLGCHAYSHLGNGQCPQQTQGRGVVVQATELNDTFIYAPQSLDFQRSLDLDRRKPAAVSAILGIQR